MFLVYPLLGVEWFLQQRISWRLVGLTLLAFSLPLLVVALGEWRIDWAILLVVQVSLFLLFTKGRRL
jgi:hypothetical protein